jgi:hypothetical protein
VNIGGGARPVSGTLRPELRANQRSYSSSQALSRRRRFSWLMRCERVSIEYMNCSGSRVPA